MRKDERDVGVSRLTSRVSARAMVPATHVPGFTTALPQNMSDTDASPLAPTSKTGLEGVYYVPSFLPQYSFVSWLQLNEEVTAHKIYNLLNHWAMKGVLVKQMNMVFSETPDLRIRLKIVSEEGEVDQTASKIQRRLHRMMFVDPRVDLVRKMRFSFADVFGYGMGIFSWEWKREGNELALKALVRLPAHSFDYPPIGQPLVFSPVLQGVTLARDPTTGLNTGQMEFWQRQSVFNFYPQMLDSESLFWLRDPIGHELAGEPICKPIIPLCEMMTYSINSHMQYVNRKGAPWFFIKVENPQGPSAVNGYVSDIDYANTILQYASKDNRYVLRPNMTVETVNFGDTSSSESVGLQTVQALNQVIVDYFSPKESVQPNQSTLGSSVGATGLYHTYVEAMRGWLSREWSRVPQYYLDANGYEGYYAIIEFPTAEVDKSDLRIKQAATALLSGVAPPLQLLEKLDFEIDIPEDLYGEGDDAVEAYLLKNAEFWNKVKTTGMPVPPQGQFGPDGKPLFEKRDGEPPQLGGAQNPAAKPDGELEAERENALRTMALGSVEERVIAETRADIARLRDRLYSDVSEALTKK